jgi:hypothetical protein
MKLALILQVANAIVGSNSVAVPFKLGGLFPLTGTQCNEGIHSAWGAKMAIDAINGVIDTETYPNMAQYATFGDVAAADGESFTMEVSMLGSTETPYGYDSQGSKPQALFWTDKILHQGVDAILGPLSSPVSETVALLSKYDNIPVISYFSPMAKLTSRETGLDTFARTFPSDRVVVKSIVDFVHEYEWEGMWFLTTNNEYGVDMSAEFSKWTAEESEGLASEFKAHLEHKQILFLDDSPELILEKLESIKDSQWRVISLVAPEEFAIKVMHAAAKLNMVKLGWVWIGAEWATSSMFANEVTEPTCATDPDTDETTCEATPDGLSTDGTAKYLTTSGDIDGMVAMRVRTPTTATSAELLKMFDAEQEELHAYNEATWKCKHLTDLQGAHLLAQFAFDAVISATKAAADLYKCGTVEDDLDTQCGKITDTYSGTKIEVQVRQPLNSYRGTSSLYNRLLQSSVSGATGTLEYVKIDSVGDGSGDRANSHIEVVNFIGGVFKVVGAWEQGATVEEEASTDAESLARAYEDCSHGHCGLLTITKDITWMGGDTAIPSDRVVTHDNVHAQYFTMVRICPCESSPPLCS